MYYWKGRSGVFALHNRHVGLSITDQRPASMREQLCHMADLVESLTTYSRVSGDSALVDLRLSSSADGAPAHCRDHTNCSSG